MDRLEAMSLLVHIADAGSLSAASRNLDIPLATVSRKLAELEAHIKTRLIIRSTRRLALTDAGRDFVTASRRILQDVEQAERQASGEHTAPKGEFVLTAPLVFGRMHILPVVCDFLAAYPEIALRLVLSDRTVNLLEDHIDVAIRIGELPDSSLIAKNLGSVSRVVCGSPAYFAEHGTPDTPQDLEQHACVTFEGLASPTSWVFADGKSTLTVRVRSRLVVNSAEAAVQAAAKGIGVTRVLSYQVTDMHRAGQLAVVLRDHEPKPWPVSLVHAGQGLLPLKIRAFIDFAVPRLRAASAEFSLSRVD